MKSYSHLNFSRASIVQFLASRYIMGVDHTFETKVMAVRIWPELPWSISRVSIYDARESDIRMKSYDHLNFSKNIRCSISSVSICYAPESDMRMKSYDHLNFSRTSVFNFERLDILYPRIEHASEKL